MKIIDWSVHTLKDWVPTPIRLREALLFHYALLLLFEEKIDFLGMSTDWALWSVKSKSFPAQ